MRFKIKIPIIQEDERDPIIKKLLDIISQCIQFINQQVLEIQQLRDEIAGPKGSSTKPKMKPGKLDENPRGDGNKAAGKRPGSKKRKKTRKLKIHKTVDLHPENIPEGSIFNM